MITAKAITVTKPRATLTMPSTISAKDLVLKPAVGGFTEPICAKATFGNKVIAKILTFFKTFFIMSPPFKVATPPTQCRRGFCKLFYKNSLSIFLLNRSAHQARGKGNEHPGDKYHNQTDDAGSKNFLSFTHRFFVASGRHPAETSVNDHGQSDNGYEAKSHIDDAKHHFGKRFSAQTGCRRF